MTWCNRLLDIEEKQKWRKKIWVSLPISLAAFCAGLQIQCHTEIKLPKTPSTPCVSAGLRLHPSHLRYQIWSSQSAWYPPSIDRGQRDFEVPKGSEIMLFSTTNRNLGEWVNAGFLKHQQYYYICCFGKFVFTTKTLVQKQNCYFSPPQRETMSLCVKHTSTLCCSIMSLLFGTGALSPYSSNLMHWRFGSDRWMMNHQNKMDRPAWSHHWSSMWCYEIAAAWRLRLIATDSHDKDGYYGNHHQQHQQHHQHRHVRTHVKHAGDMHKINGCFWFPW